MFEVGKKYKNKNNSSTIYNCIAVHNNEGWLLINDTDDSIGTYSFGPTWKEYVPEDWRILVVKGQFSKTRKYYITSTVSYSSKEKAELAMKDIIDAVKVIRVDD